MKTSIDASNPKKIDYFIQNNIKIVKVEAG